MIAKIKIFGINRWNINRVASQQKIFLSDKMKCILGSIRARLIIRYEDLIGNTPKQYTSKNTPTSDNAYGAIEF